MRAQSVEPSRNGRIYDERNRGERGWVPRTAGNCTTFFGHLGYPQKRASARFVVSTISKGAGVIYRSSTYGLVG